MAGLHEGAGNFQSRSLRAARMQARQEATYGKTYYWRPDEALPHAAPDLAKAVGSSKVNLAGLE